MSLDDTYELNGREGEGAAGSGAAGGDAHRDERREAAKQRIAQRSAAQDARPSAALPPDVEFHVYTPKFCISCNEDLTEFEDPGVCPRCGRPFHPGDPKTYLDEPIPEKAESFWLGPPRLAGYGVLVLFVLGRLVISTLAVGWQGEKTAAPVFGAAMLAVSLPWLAACVYLLLIVLRDYINPRFVVLLPVCLALGVLLTLGAPPLTTAVAVLVAPMVALLRAWRVE